MIKNRQTKTIRITQRLTPPKFHEWLINKVTRENPEYTIIEDFNDE